MMFRSKIAAVSYLNTIPFIYGIEHARLLQAELLLSPPSRCVTSFDSGAADIALVPSAAVPHLKDAQIITSYCIGAHDPVRTVTIMSNHAASDIKRLYLDSHSRTSVLLARILCDGLWNICPEYVHLDDYSLVDNPQPGDGFVLIGDKVFDYEGRFAHTYDLAECWQKWTGLPFVFAVWIARAGVPQQTIDELQESLTYGVAHIPEAIAYYGHSGKPYALEYLTKNIDFVFDSQKHKALSLFWEKGLKFDPRENPG